MKTGEKTTLEFPPGISIGSELINDDEIIMTINRPLSPSTLMRFNLNTQESEILLETDMGTIDKSLFVDGEHIFYPSLDGTEIPGIVYKPRDFDPNKKNLQSSCLMADRRHSTSYTLHRVSNISQILVM